MRSFALWYSTVDKEKLNKGITVHVNLWDKKEKNNYCFDFGLLVEDLKGIEKIFLYVPFTLDISQIKDLGGTISNNNLVNAIFNENFTTTQGEPKRLIVNGNSSKPKFIIYSLDIENQINLSSCKRNTYSPGTILEIRTEDIQIQPTNISRYYFRIRIEVGKHDVKFINDEIKGLSVFSDQFTNTEVIDFRLNDVRSCSEELREQFNKGQQFLILAVHYLILRNANDVIVHYGKEMNSRMLENDLWRTYIDGDNHNIIAYHIKSKATQQADGKYKCLL